MKLLSCSEGELEEAARALSAGLLVALPTETVYGLGADAFNPPALARIFEAKRRPTFDPLIVHIATLASLDRLVDRSALSRAAAARLERLATALWPGPLTLILPKQADVPDLATSGLPTVAVRFPSHPIARRLIELSTGAIAAPSANPFGYLSPTTAAHVAEQLGERVDFIVDGGPCAVGVESTILDLSSDEPTVLRPGGTPITAIEAVIGKVALFNRAVATPTAPGQLKSHYAPHAALSLHERGTLDELEIARGSALIFFEEKTKRQFIERQGSGLERDLKLTYRVLSCEGNGVEAASALFSTLHELDRLGIHSIYAEKAPAGGLGDAINDRLYKARSATRG